MGNLKTYTRRSFLVGSVVIAGGIAFGGWKALKNPLNPLGDAAMNPWLILHQKEIIVIVPRAEMAQGIQTTLAALVAEELHVRLSDIDVEHRPPAKVYFNGAVAIDRSYEAALEDKPSG